MFIPTIAIIFLVLAYYLNSKENTKKIKQLEEENSRLQWEKWDKESSTWESDLPEEPILSECKLLTKIKEALKEHNKKELNK
jgi:hypothetical protein